ncbi:glycosyltransferase family 4 protein [Facklamia miroungae]|uniref:Glycosyltransferase involved in cell wall bisynthesis n=1 Tax=Facklamia miroungae TaxID=120956 RepID=A0A1G7TI77_9LACT|nr:glycosyltransferase family 1 protein [Facklamia miroungae]NKZ29832.1 glycosyltransferase family 1 protein [Facklamia miroungae]SDG34802.1 Glycosyltransferase involved in cell wall bisynthesis [Facklamia miroungae]
MRILIATETFVPATDGICTRLANMTTSMKKLGHEVVVVSPDLGIEEYQGVKVIPMDSFSFPLYKSRPWGLPSRKMKRIIEDFNPDIVHAVNPFFMVTSAVKYAKRLEIPLLTSYHTHIPDYLDHYNLPLLKPILWDYIRFWHQDADLNITVSESLQTELIDQGIATEGVLPRGIDLNKRHPKFFDQELYEKWTFGLKDQKLLVYVGRLAAEKDLDHLLPIFANRDDVCLTIVGDGPEKQRLTELFDGTKTTFTGFLDGEALSKAYATGDAFIFPSISETFGLVISESMASGVPVIAAENGPTLEQIEPNQSGMIYQSGNIESMIEALKILDNPLKLKELGLKARREAEKYSWENATRKLLDYYEETIHLNAQKLSHFNKLVNL